MINENKICWICKKKIGKSGSEHHLFNSYDYKRKMIETFELDKEFDKKKIKLLRLKFKKIKPKIPSYKVHTKCHQELEKRLRAIENKKVRGERGKEK